MMKEKQEEKGRGGQLSQIVGQSRPALVLVL